MWTQQKIKIKNWLATTGFEHLSPIWGCSLNCSVLHLVQQFNIFEVIAASL